jgi:hypothetical protein
MASDPHKARAEFLNIWREDLTECFPFDAVDAGIDPDIFERSPLPNTLYTGYVDGASGGGSDSFTLGIAHRNPGSEIAVLDLLRERKPRFIAYEVIAEYAAILKSYRCSEVYGDQYAFQLFADEFRKHQIIMRESDNTTSENYLRALPLLLGRRARLLNNLTLRSQLLSLERRVVDGHEEVNHPKNINAHDDVATAACGALVTVATRSRYTLLPFDPNYVDIDAPQPPPPEPLLPPQANGNWWRSMPRSQPTYSADERLRGFYQSLDLAFKSGFFR